VSGFTAFSTAQARPTPSQPASLVLLTLAEALKTLNAAAYTGNLGHFCEAGMAQALHNLGLVKSTPPPPTGSTSCISTGGSMKPLNRFL